MNKTEIILQRILSRSKKPGAIRTFIIGIIFPEFAAICGDLSELCDHLKL